MGLRNRFFVGKDLLQVCLSSEVSLSVQTMYTIVIWPLVIRINLIYQVTALAYGFSPKFYCVGYLCNNGNSKRWRHDVECSSGVLHRYRQLESFDFELNSIPCETIATKNILAQDKNKKRKEKIGQMKINLRVVLGLAQSKQTFEYTPDKWRL